MCDGFVDEVSWILRSRATGEALRTATGYTFVFSEEAEARAFRAGRADGPDLELVEVHTAG
jgi:hypothetical protein